MENPDIDITQRIKQLGDGVTLEWQRGGKVAIYTLKNTKRTTVDDYIDSVFALVRARNPIFLVVDASDPKVDMTRYMRNRLDSIADYIRTADRKGYVAVVLPTGFMTQLLSIFTTMFARNAQSYIQQMFTSRAAALTWIETRVDENDATA